MTRWAVLTRGQLVLALRPDGHVARVRAEVIERCGMCGSRGAASSERREVGAPRPASRLSAVVFVHCCTHGCTRRVARRRRRVVFIPIPYGGDSTETDNRSCIARVRGRARVRRGSDAPAELPLRPPGLGADSGGRMDAARTALQSRGKIPPRARSSGTRYRLPRRDRSAVPVPDLAV